MLNATSPSAPPRAFRRRILRLADNEDPRSLSTRMRRRRMRLFDELVRELPDPVRVLDVGGTARFWRTAGEERAATLDLTIVNRRPVRPGPWRSVVGDARRLSFFGDGAFDCVFSNSLIEHFRTPEEQEAVAREIERLGRTFLVQTPNRYFPIEPHFLFPFFQFLPRWIRIALVRRFALGWKPAQRDPRRAAERVDSIRLLDRKELLRLFPGAEIHREPFLGWSKSFIAVRRAESEEVSREPPSDRRRGLS